ncbi:MAG: hypothetical protein ACO3XO_08555 [Bdellovibrionota bacterium]
MAASGSKKKSTKAQNASSGNTSHGSLQNEITNSKDLKEFLLSIRDRMADDQAAPINVISVMNYVFNISNIEELLDEESKEVARDIWLRVKQAGVQLRNPGLLFDADEAIFSQNP